ncbi:MAG: glutamate synthase, partial [Gemmatimonadetes bacterium]|nr:glutamate synthase [Gemmatimonadota bacterium]
MADLHPIPFPDLLRRMRREVAAAESIFDLPIRKWYIPDDRLDFSATHFSRRAAAPLGPAAGPHTQLAQNIVLAWLAGGRIMELKTVQVKDDLQIPRPCIHVPNVGFNVEWSQELSVRDSLGEYAKAAYLIEILKHTRGFGSFPSAIGFETIFDISVGYDLDGIRTPKVTEFIRS